MAVDPLTAVFDLVKTGLDKFVRDKVDEGTLKQIDNDFQKHILTEARQAESGFRQFILAYEGEAKDYKDVPFVGPLLMLLRGAIRPLFTVAVGWWDWLFFTQLQPWETEKISLLGNVNLIVLLFWFGERAVTNSGIIETLTKVFVTKK